MTHDHDNAEPGHGYDWHEYFGVAVPRPAGLAATPGAGRVRLAWAAPEARWNVTRHEYRFRPDGSGWPASWTAIPDSGLDGRHEAGYTVTGLADGTRYDFELRAVNGTGESEAASASAETPAPPAIERVAVTSTPDGDAYGAGDGIRIAVTFDRAVQVEGDPEFGLSVGGPRVAAYRWGSGTEVLVFVYTVRPDDRDRDGIWIGDHDHAETPTFRLDGDDRIRNAAGQDAALTHALLGRLSGHKVNGGGPRPGANMHSHQEFTHSHSHFNDGKGSYTDTYPPHTHAYHVHHDSENGHPEGLRPGHVHHAQEDTSLPQFGPDLFSTHGGVLHTHFCWDIEADCSPDKETLQIADELGLPVRVTHAHEAESEPGHRYDWAGYFREAGTGPLLSVTGAAATEGDDGALDFTVRLDREPRAAVTVEYHTQDDGTATAATAGADYTATRGTLTFAPGETAQTVSVPIVDDTEEDDGETFALVLANASGAGIWTDGGEATGTIRNREAAEGPAGLTASFEDMPAAHDGADAFTFRVAFSENIGISYRSLREDAFAVTGGRVTGGERVDDRRDLFEMTVEPEGEGEVTVTLPAGRECAVSWAICTKGETRRQLTNAPTATVAGPAVETGPAGLTASFEDMPAAHAGAGAFTFRVAFSENIGISYRSLREDAFTVSGGRVTRGKRVDDRRDLFEMTVEPDGGGAVTVTLPAGRECAVSGAICTKGETRRQLTNAPTATVAGPAVAPAVEPLTAAFEGIPAEHDGQTAFTLRIAFSETLRMSGRRLRANVVAVAGGRATKAGRVHRRKDLWKLTVRPDSLADVTVTLAAGAVCDSSGAVCTADGRALSNTISTVVKGPVTVSVADARAREGEDETLDFAVTLSRAASGTVAVAYATADGSARAGLDYTARKGQLSFAPGETEKTLSVPVLDDAHDEGAETMQLRLPAASGALIADGEATGTIVNSDPLQRAWLARFGRTVATHVTDAVGDRLRGTPGPASHVTVGGYRLPLETLFGGADATAPAAADPEVFSLRQWLRGAGPGPASGARAPAWLQGVAGVLGLGPPQRTGPWTEPPGGSSDPRLGQSRTLNLTLRQVLLGSSFRLTLGRDDVGSSRPRLTAWGRVAGTRFNGRDGKVTLDGDVLTGTVGVDGAWDRLLAGVAVAHSQGDGSYTMPVADDSGNLEQTLTSLHPYLRYAVNDRLAVWGLLGYGWGELELEMDTGETRETRETDTNLVMGAFGGRGILLSAAESGGFQLATRTDAMLTRTTSDAVETADGNMASGDAEAHRLRLVLEGSRGFAWAEGRRLTPTMEVGLRHDWGDAETGFGLELGGRVRYADPALGLTIDAAVRGLLAHEDRDYQEWGASGTVRIDPGAGGQGLALTLAPTWGAASSGVEGLWSRQTTAGLAPNTRRTQAGRLNAEVGYGFAPFDTGLLTPYAGTVLSEGAARTYRVGGRLQMRGGWATGLTLSLEGQRQEPAGQQPATQGLRLQVGWGF